MLSMGVDRNATLTGPDEVDFDAAGGHVIAVFATRARQKEEKKAHTVEGLVRTWPMPNLTSARLTEMANAKTLRAEDRAPTLEAAARVNEAEDDDRKIVQAKAEIAEVESDLARLREHMKAFAGDRQGPAAQNPFAARVLAGEDRLTATRKRLETLQADRKAKGEAAETALAKLVR
jgi:acetyl esterase/lipase